MESKKCRVCGSEMPFDGYNGDWGVWKCQSDECDSEIQKPVSDATEDGFTMESLGRVSDYVHSDN